MTMHPGTHPPSGKSARAAREQSDLAESEQRFRRLTALSSDWHWELDEALQFTLISDGFADKLGNSDDLLIGNPCWELAAGDADRAALRAILQRREPFRDFDVRHLRANGGIVHLSLSGEPMLDAAGRFCGYHGVGSDITARKESEELLRQAATVFTSTHEGVVITDPKCCITAVNSGFSAITGYSEQEVLGKHIDMLQSDRHGPDFYQEMWTSIEDSGYWQGEIWKRRKNGDDYPQWLTLSAVRDEKGAVIRYVGVFSDITRVKQSQDRLEHLAHHDALTDMPNRLVLLSHLDKAIARAKRHQSRCAVLYLDLDRFKNVNDSLGHSAGDELLVLVAQRLRRRVRGTDTVARVGGDEFVVLLDDVAETQHAALVALSLIDEFKAPFVLSGGHKVCVGASIGISLFPEDSEDGKQLLRYADAALYQAKEGGGGAYRFYTSALMFAAKARLELEAHLRRALTHNEFLLYYQPQISVADGRVKGAEALVRWVTPAKVVMPAGEFIPLAEETGLIFPLGDWVLRSACTQMQKWVASGTALQTVAVNLSPRQFRQPDLYERVRAILSDTGLPPQRLELEITEAALMDYTEPAVAKLAALKALGVRLSIDDFGIGYSSFSCLKYFAVDKLKMDKSFVRDITLDGAGMKVATAIIGLAKSLNLEAVAEGVETETQLEFLRSHGCDRAQGYLFGRPVPSNELRVPGVPLASIANGLDLTRARVTQT